MADNVLICGANWLGDSIMSMPAIQMFKREWPSCRITMLVKSGLISLWAIHSAVDEVIELCGNLMGTLKTAGTVKKRKFDMTFILPNSFRSALIPFLARVPVRTGVPGHQRAWMLTHTIRGERGSATSATPSGRLQSDAKVNRTHQAWEYVNIMGLADDGGELAGPRLSLPQTVVEKCRRLVAEIEGGDWIGLIPGAVYGPSKRWPSEYFIEVGQSLIRSERRRILVFGAKDEIDLCSKVAEGIGDGALNLAGKTSLPEFAALLELCRVVVTNDSGGMHLAAAVGTRVVAIFGLTDPARTGPLGPDHSIILQEGITRSRDIERDSTAAIDSLRSVKPDRVFSAAMELLGQRSV